MAEIRADMVANVMEIYVAVGDAVNVGDTIVLLESMKMEIPVESPADGKVSQITVKEGQPIKEGDILAVIE